jgi:HlyD family secretion protein
MAHRALVAVAAALLLAGCGGGTEARQETAQDQARSVRVGFVATRPLELGITASGRLVPREEATVGSELSGYRVAQVFAGRRG